MYEEGFRVTVNGQTGMTDKPAYREGETVRIRIPPAMDVNIRVTCDDAEVRYAGLADGFLSYEFEMPARDCDVRVSMVNSMNRPPKAGLGSLFKKRKKDAPERAERKKDRYRVTVETPVPEGEGIICPDCGKRYEGPAPKFCPECGCRLG